MLIISPDGLNPATHVTQAWHRYEHVNILDSNTKHAWETNTNQKNTCVQKTRNPLRKVWQISAENREELANESAGGCTLTV